MKIFEILLLNAFLFLFLISVNAQSGLINYNVGSSYEGYTLYPAGTNVYLIDNCGKLIHEWDVDNTVSLSTYLMEDGNLLYMSKLNSNTSFQGGGGGGGRLQIYSPNSTLLWQYDFYSSGNFCVHHDVEPLPNGNILAIAWEEIPVATAIAEGRSPSSLSNKLWAEKVLEIQPIGTNNANIVWEWRAMDHLIQDIDPSKNNYGVVANHPELLNFNTGGSGIDWLHFNGIDYNPALDQILLSSRHLSEIYIIDHSTTDAQADGHTGGNSGKGGDFLYRYGNPQNYDRGTSVDRRLFTQHDAQWITDGYVNGGKISIFNNGGGRPAGTYSSADVITVPVSSTGIYPALAASQAYPPTGPTIEFDTGPTGSTFYSGNQGGAHGLPNGNMLICNANSAEYFEVDGSTGQVVWEYESPFGGSTFKTPRYEPSYPGLSFFGLAPGNTVESPSSIASNGCTVYYTTDCSSVTTSFSGLPPYTSSSSPISLIGSPTGGTFSGTGIIFSAFNPTIAGAGTHIVTYTYTDANDCVATDSQSILVFTITYNFVNYNLGTIAPKISSLSSNIEFIDDGIYNFELINIEGKVLHQTKINVEAFNIDVDLDIKELPKGAYIARFYNDKHQISDKFVVTH